MAESGQQQAFRPRILVLRGGAIGDFILTLPALQALRREWPESHIELIGYPHIASLAQECGLVDKVVSIDRSDMAKFFSLRPAIPEELVVYVRSFSFVLTYLYDPEGTVGRNLLSTGVRQVLYCTPRVDEGHASDHLVKPLESLAIYPDCVPCPCLRLREETIEGGRAMLGRYGRRVVVIHPGSGGKAKRWPLDRFLALAGDLRRGGDADVVFSTGEADGDLVAGLRAAGEEDRIVAGLSLVSLAGVLKASYGYVGNDSGITHMAAALGIPAVALFGATEPAMWGPRGARVRILRGAIDGRHDVAGIDVGRALEAVREVFAAPSGTIS